MAFLIPLIEKLYTLKWTPTDGLGALVITPTRELAYQIFETLKKIGKYHDFSAGLVIGGKDLKYETDRLSNCNIIICTPGKGPFIYYVRGHSTITWTPPPPLWTVFIPSAWTKTRHFLTPSYLIIVYSLKKTMLRLSKICL